MPGARLGPPGSREGIVEQGGDVLGRDATRAQHLRRVDGAVDDRRLDTDRARPAVEDEVDVVAEVGAHVIGSRRADPAEAVGRRCGQPAAEAGQQLQRQRMSRHANTHGRPPAGDDVEHVRRPRHEQRQRARPARVGEHGRSRGDRRRPVAQLLGRGRGGRSAGGRPAGPSRRRSAARHRGSRHRRRARRRSRSEWRRARRRAAPRARDRRSLTLGRRRGSRGRHR